MTITERKITNEEIANLLKQRVTYFANQRFDAIIGVARGGMIPATMLAYTLNKPLYCISVKSYNDDKEQGDIEMLQFPTPPFGTKRLLIVDDINDTGNTFKEINNYCLINHPHLECSFYSLFAKNGNKFPIAGYSELVPKDVWLSFPWEVGL